MSKNLAIELSSSKDIHPFFPSFNSPIQVDLGGGVHLVLSD